MSRIRVAVLRGGPSGEYEVSLQTGGTVLRELPDKYQPLDILISKEGLWHRDGVAVPIHEALVDADVVFNALHGTYGEDGGVQQELDALSIPYTGSGALASGLGMDKLLSKKHFASAGLKTPVHRALTMGKDAERELMEIFRGMPHPVVVKPSSSGSSLGVSIANTFDELVSSAHNAAQYSPQVIIEECIKGREATCAVVDNYRGQDIYALFPIEIVPKESDFFDYEAKYQGKSLEICPSLFFSAEEKRQIERIAVKVHKILGLRHYSRTDFIVSSKRGVYLLETNTLPGLTSESLFPKALNALGFPFSEFLDHVLTLALQGK